MSLFKHDCDKCKYIGSTHGQRQIDWYKCDSSVVARFGDEGPQYWSMDAEMVRTASRETESEMLIMARYMLNKTKKKTPFQVASGLFLTDEVPDNFDRMNDKEQMTFIKDHRWEALDTYSAEDLYVVIQEAADYLEKYI